MPRDGSDVYIQPFPNVVADTTIESTVYNGFVADVALDLNTPRPIIAGGTDAANAADALFNLGAEKAAQVVTNYDSHLWVPGSFYSASSATNPPVAGHAFAGVVYINEALAQPPTNANVIVEARDLDDAVTPGQRFVREKKAGVWGSWYADGFQTFGGNAGISSSSADMFAGFSSTPQAFIINTESDVSGTDVFAVQKSGNTVIQGVPTAGVSSATVVLNKVGATGGSQVQGSTNGTARWLMQLCNGAAETGSNTGSNLALHRYADNGVYLGSPFSINRATGLVSFTEGAAGVQINGTDGLAVAGPTMLGGGVISNLPVAGYVSGYGPSFAPSAINNAAFRVTGPYGGGLWMQDGTAGGAIWMQNEPTMRFGIAGSSSTTASEKLQLHSTGIYVTGVIGTGSTVTSTADFGVQVYTPGGTHARYRSIVTAARDWSFGCLTDGVFNIRDETAGAQRFYIDAAGKVGIPQALQVDAGVYSYGYRTKAGIGSGYSANWFNIDHAASQGLYIDSTLVGLFAYTSDYRTKKDVTGLPNTWDRVKALRPIKYTRKEFSPPSHHEFQAKLKAEAERIRKEGGTPESLSDAPFMPGDDTEQWGFVAHELQETLTASASTGVKDAPNAIQSPNPWTVIAALTKALQEAMARIEALEAK